MLIKKSATRDRKQSTVKLFYPPPSESIIRPWTICVYNAAYEPERWQRYNQAANRSYAARKLNAVGEEQVIDIDRYPTYYAEATLDSHSDEPIGGVRIHTPDPTGRLPLLDELDGYIDIQILQKIVDKLLPEGIGHGGGLWINSEYRRSGLAGDLARACNAMITAIHARWYVAATHQYSLDAWGTLGWYPISTLPTIPYPDERYQTVILQGDQNSWPDDLKTWAEKQVVRAKMGQAGPRFTVEPMRQSG